ncbi:MAG TPA: hypothetical protein VFZ08_04410 [Terriglobia bacterium]|nr:hypothetical protein [Terriglobia bacterium]
MAKNRNFFGLALPEGAREKLRRAGIFVQTMITVEHQHLARRYVVRGVESGGAVEGFGHYVTFAAEDGSPLPYLCPVESLAVNGPHAVAVAQVLLRAEMLRAGHTYELLITRHQPGAKRNGKRPVLLSAVAFRGEHGYLGAGEPSLPVFFTRAGEPLGVPENFVHLVASLTAATCCAGCCHSHFLLDPAAVEGGNSRDDGSRVVVATL